MATNPAILIETIETEKFGSFSVFFNPKKKKRFYFFDRFDEEFKSWKEATDFLDKHLLYLERREKHNIVAIAQHIKAINKILVDNKLNIHCNYTFPNYGLEFIIRDNSNHYLQNFKVDRYIQIRLK